MSKAFILIANGSRKKIIKNSWKFYKSTEYSVNSNRHRPEEVPQHC